MNTKKGWKALVLNLIVPGLGQVYARDFKKGIIFYILFFVIVFSLRFISYNFILFLSALSLIVGYYLYLLINGYNSVQKGKEYEHQRLDKWYSYIAIIFVHIAISNSIPRKTLNELTPINFANIPTPAMDPTLQVGDILAYKKTAIINRSDVVIFKYPKDIKTLYIKRCVGLPGDNLQIKNRIVFINGDTLRDIPALKYKYVISTRGQSINPRLFNELSISDYYKIKGNNYVAHLTPQQASELGELGFIENVNASITNKNEGDRMIFPNFYNDTWNTDYYGPIYIPKKGDRIQLNLKNINIYASLIEFENESVELNDSLIFINGSRIDTYEVKENYYFMMGDNRHNSLDSRYWGFLPEQLIVGQAMYLYWSRSFNRIGRIII